MTIRKITLIVTWLWLATCSYTLFASGPSLDLEGAYTAQDTGRLRAKLREWREYSRTITDREWDRLPPSAKAAYEIYQIFFRLAAGRGNVGKRFVMSQKSLRINVRETLDRAGGEPGNPYREPPLIRYELHNIRPRMAELRLNLLYLDDYTEGQIFRFLATAPGPVKRQYDIRLDPRISREEKQKRLQFITRELVIHVVGWGDLELALPRVFDIDFDRDLNSAVVSYRLRSSGGHELFHRVEGSWMRRREGPLRPTWHN